VLARLATMGTDAGKQAAAPALLLQSVSKPNAQQPFTPCKQRKERQGAEDAENT